MTRRAIMLAVLLTAAAVAVIVAVAVGSHGPEDYSVRAIFDDAPVNVGADVLVAGVQVGRVTGQDVTPEHKAALTLQINDPRFVPFHVDARCGTRQQSLIGERAVACESGSARARPLATIRSGAGEGQHALPVTRTYSTVDLDLVNAIYRRPAPEQLTVLLSELGAGVATRGPALASIIRRANPGLDEADRLIRVLAAQREQLAQLAVDGDRIMRPLARRRRDLAGFIRASERTAAVTVENNAAYGDGVEQLPAALRDLRPLMAQLDRFARGTAPVLRTIAAGAPDLGRATAAIPAFARETDPTLRALAASTAVQARQLTRAVSLAHHLTAVGRTLPRPASDTSRLLESFRAGNGIPNLLHTIFRGASSANGFDGSSHYVRAEVLSGTCGAYTSRPFYGCDAQFGAPAAQASARAAAARVTPLLDYLLGSTP